MSNEVNLSLELVQDLDIRIGRLVGLIKNPSYTTLVEEYELDTVQCLLWWDMAQMLSYVLAADNYEEAQYSYSLLGEQAKLVMAEVEDKFYHLKQLLLQYEILNNNEEVGKILAESLEDIRVIYDDIEGELDEILSSQEDIERLVDDAE